MAIAFSCNVIGRREKQVTDGFIHAVTWSAGVYFSYVLGLIALTGQDASLFNSDIFGKFPSAKGKNIMDFIIGGSPAVIVVIVAIIACIICLRANVRLAGFDTLSAGQGRVSKKSPTGEGRAKPNGA